MCSFIYFMKFIIKFANKWKKAHTLSIKLSYGNCFH